ncbi:DUF5134 domain-containing protein [Amycolatopsis sp. GM8]|uniref:DUF5134 domain-containing protein n=1 Tax=Amycolatopsis sp. GM8 TaxID=2896530 RepID=UPI001F281385|nr:DUF5134 domain-containing protein [Amycolatopsis sp. GM8]
MITELGLRWGVTLVFAVAGGFCLYRCLSHGPATHRVADVLHTLMCAGMVAMSWPAGMNFAHVPQLLLFSAAAVWFVGMLVLGTDGHGAHGRLSLGHHALMMAGMAWMVLVMPSAMSGMTMSGMTMDTPAHVVIVAVVLALVFLVAGVGWLAHAVDTGRGEGTVRLRTAGLAVDGVMSLGMGLMAALLI